MSRKKSYSLKLLKNYSPNLKEKLNRLNSMSFIESLRAVNLMLNVKSLLRS